MGSVISSVVKTCEKLKKLFTPARKFIDSTNDFSNGNKNILFIKKEEFPKSHDNGNTEVSNYNKYYGYNPPSNKFQKTLLTSENFKDFISITTKMSAGRTSNISDLSNYSIIGHKLTNNSNINYNYNLNSRNKYFGQLGSSKEFNFTYPHDKFIQKSFSDQKIKCKLEDFTIIKLLGRGTFGKVLLVRNVKDSKLYAMKVLKKQKLYKTNQINHTKTEREILEKINHPFIVKLQFAFQTEENLYIVTEFMQGGELFYHLKKESYFPETRVKIYLSEIVLAIEHLHKNKIIYRDLKPENILLDLDGHIKLADFGLSKFFNNQVNKATNSCNHNNLHEVLSNKSENSENSDKAFTLCGTPEYLAPEILIGKGYDKSVDWWSLGVLSFEMLCGHSPFKRRRDRKLSLNYYSTPIEFISENIISDNAKNLVLGFLKKEPSERLSNLNEIKSHPFFQEIDWEATFNKKTNPIFVPKNYVKNEEDLALFDKTFTESALSNCEGKLSKHKLNRVNNNEKSKKIIDEFENFSFVREDIGVSS
jgi:serine/threonine protein kinase